MQIFPNQLYHIYNQGNNRETIFKDREDYINFLRKYRELVYPIADTICYCLMPNHFHFLINSTTTSSEKFILGNIESVRLGNAFRVLCSSYANDFNKKYSRTGSLFRQKTQAKNLETRSDGSQNDTNYPLICFHYIHQNPITAGLCTKMEDWEFSSFQDFINLRSGTLINKGLAFELIEIPKENLYNESYKIISEEKFQKLFAV
ncbi:MAG: transposase [Spirosomataceae bacterium]